MAESEAESLLASDEDICVSFLSDEAGLIRFQPEPIVPAHRLLRRASVASAAGLTLALAACTPHTQPTLDPQPERPAFLEVQPSIPDAEPCDAPDPDALRMLGRAKRVAEPESDDLVRVKGDVAYEPEPEPEHRPQTRRKGRPATRTAGVPIRRF